MRKKWLPSASRVSKTVGGEPRYFLYDDTGRGLVGEYSETGALIRGYVYPPGSAYTRDPVALKSPVKTVGQPTGYDYSYYQNDHLGTPQRLMQKSGVTVWQGEYDAFGAVDEVVSHVQNPLRFPGQYYDKETGLHQNYFRTYDPGIGKYIQQDKLDVLHRSNDPSLAVTTNMGLISLPVNGIGFLRYEGKTYNYTEVVGDIGLNHPFGYSNQNPINEFDANGLHPVVRAFAIAMAVAKAMKKQIEKGIDYCKSVRCKIENHDAHHRFGFPFNERRKHIQLTCWRKGVKGSTFIIRFPY